MIHRRYPRAVLAVLPAGLALTCNGLTEPRVERRAAIIEFHSDPVRIEAPDTVIAGSPFTVSVRSYGGGCISQGDTEVSINGLLATMRPFDLELTGPNVVCTRELRLFEHLATIRFDQTGTATVRVVGRREPGSEPLSVDRTLVVR